MYKINKSKRGFTMVELMMATVAFAALSLAVGSMLVYGWMGWRRANDWIEMQRSASLSMMTISKEVRNTRHDLITEGAGLALTRMDGSAVTFSDSGSSIVRSTDGFKLVDGWLVPGSFKTYKYEEVGNATQFKTNQWVEIDFTLATSTETEAYTIKVSPRN